MEAITEFIVEDGYNTSYIDTVLFALFYPSDRFKNYIEINKPQNANNVFYTELVKSRIVSKLQKNLSIRSSDINYVRNYSYFMGWLAGSPINDLLGLHGVEKYFSFLAMRLELKPIEVMHNNAKVSMPYIQINLPATNNERVGINKLVDNVICNETNTEGKMTIVNYPFILPIFLNRLTSNKTQVNIMKRIKIDGKMVDYDNIRWTIYSIICKDIVANSYYCLFKRGTEWYIFNNKLTPCIVKIKLDDIKVNTRVMEECVLVFYIMKSN